MLARDRIHAARTQELVREESYIPYAMGFIAAVGVPIIVVQAKSIYDKYNLENAIGDQDVLARSLVRKERHGATMKLLLSVLVTGGLLLGLGLRQRKVAHKLDHEIAGLPNNLLVVST